MSKGAIAVLTSGGDAPGMNAVVRAVVRTGINKGFDMLGVKRGYKGLLKKDFVEMDLRSVTNVISLGGTILYTARSHEFRSLEGQQKAAANCKEMGVKGVVVIG